MMPPFTYNELVEEHGAEVADQALKYRRHYHDEFGSPCWLLEELDDLLEIMRIEAEQKEALYQ